MLFFFFVVVVFGLARDGCLVRSWFGVAQRGGAAGRRADGAVSRGPSRPSRTSTVQRGLGGLSLRNDDFT